MTRRSFFQSSALGSLGALALAPASNIRAATVVGLEPIFATRGWINGRLTPATATGRVVLVDVFTFECINCTRVTPNLQTLYRTHGREQLEIVAVHTPEVPAYQGRAAYVASEARRVGLPWPIAIDTDYRIWNAYGIDAWPTQLVFDRRGRLAARIVGDSQDTALNDAIVRALRA